MDHTVITVENGRISGQIEKDYLGRTFYSFSGIPYAKAPLGELRFKAPEPHGPWEGIRDGKREGPACPHKFMNGFFVGYEDNCLNLNIYIKELPKQQKKSPVMVYIHGGGFMFGSNMRKESGPEYLLTENIVLVVINYRLGVLGFLSLEDPSLGVPGNAGLKDQVFALKWVQKNIHNFGGDPDNVTIFGESAGSASVHYLILSPLTEGLFHKAIMQSGSALNPWARGRRNGLDIAKSMGFTDIDEKVILQKLQEASVKSLMNAQFQIDCCLPVTFDACQIRPFGPVIEYPHEGAFLAEDPIEIMKSGRSRQIPIIMGFNSLEGLFYGFIRARTNVPSLPKSLEKDIPYEWNISQDEDSVKKAAEKIRQFYFQDCSVSEENIVNKYKLFGDVIFVHGIQKTARLLKLHGNTPIYMYRMSLESSLNNFKKLCVTNHLRILIITFILGKIPGCGMIFTHFSNMLSANDIKGTAHVDDLHYLFKSWLSPEIVEGSEEDRHIKKFVRIWTNFAKYGNPTPEKDKTLNDIIWEPIKSDTLDNIVDIDRTITITRNLEGRRMAFWDDMYEKYSTPERFQSCSFGR